MKWIALMRPDFVVKKEDEFHLPLSEDMRKKSCSIVMLLVGLVTNERLLLNLQLFDMVLISDPFLF